MTGHNQWCTWKNALDHRRESSETQQEGRADETRVGVLILLDCVANQPMPTTAPWWAWVGWLCGPTPAAQQLHAVWGSKSPAPKLKPQLVQSTVHSPDGQQKLFCMD